MQPYVVLITVSTLLAFSLVIWENNSAKQSELLIRELVRHCERDSFPASNPLRNRLLRRLEEFKQEHIANNQPHAIGLRGVSWIHRHLNGALIASPNVAESLLNTDEQGWATVRFVDVSEKQQCPPEMANLVSIYVRFSGPELMAVVAEPVLGKCEWKAKVQFTIPGEYTVLARLLHYNGKLDITEDCELQTDLAQVRFKLMHKIPRYPYYVNDPDCRKMCTRYERCTHSMGFTSNGTPCYLFTESNNSDSFLASEVFIKYNESETKLQVGLCRKTVPFTKQEWVWQLGCGRDEMLLRWASCAGLNQTQTGRRMKAVEDMILFEFEHSNLAVPLLRSKTKLTLDQAQREFDSPVLPVCTSIQLAQYFDNGRWTRTPDWRTIRCPPLEAFVSSHDNAAPPTMDEQDPICNLRFKLNNAQSGGVWQTELSDTYFPTQVHHQLWTGYFRLSPQATCAMPRMYTPTQIRECVATRNLEFYFGGDSVAKLFVHYFLAHLRLAFPERLFSHNDYKFTFNTSIDSATATRVLLSNFQIPTTHGRHSLHGMRRDLENQDRELFPEDMNHRVFLSPPIGLWEAQSGATSLHMQQAAHLMRDILAINNGWTEINLHRLSREWAMDASLNHDGLHVVAHSLQLAVQLLFHSVC
ncbi:hypothetical protein BASA81_007778 [Batrachochytrium salamandrivorans]|nr:hypothetical protein BASA81_007778 [Batrachochytrium salamandrivorans]